MGRSQVLAHRFDGAAVRSGFLFQFFRFFSRSFDGGTFGLFHVGGVFTGIAVHNARFPAVRQGHEFMAALAADGAAVRFHRPVIQAAPGEDPAVGIVFILVGFVQAFRILVKG